MFRFFRDGLYRDYIILILVTIIVGAAVSSGVAWAVDAYFGDTIQEMIGDNGEYDLILHIREASEEAAYRELERIAQQQYPGAVISKTISLAGQVNYLFGFPQEAKTVETFSRLPSIFNAVPGLNAYTVIVEPSVLVRGVHPSVSEVLQQRFNEIDGVSFAFNDGKNMLIVLESAEHSKTVMNEARRIIKEYQVLEIRFPMGFDVDVQTTGNEVMQLLSQEYPGTRLANVSSAEYGEELDALMKTLVEMRHFLLSYASKVKIKLEPQSRLVVGEQILVQGVSEQVPVTGQDAAPDHVMIEILEITGDQAQGMIVSGSVAANGGILTQPGYKYMSENKVGQLVGEVQIENERYRLNYAINESLRLLRELDDLSVEAATAVERADKVLTTFQEALMQLEVLQVQMQQLNKGLAENGVQSTSEQLIISLFLNGLLKNIAKSGSEAAAEFDLGELENLDVASMRSSLSNLAEQIGSIQEIDVQAIIDQITDIRDSLPELDDEEIGKSVHLVDNYIAGQVIPGERIQILVENGSIDEEKVEPLIRDQLQNQYLNIYSIAVGTVNPDTRTEVFRILKEVRATIAGILSIVLVGVFLMLDHATIFSTLKWFRANQKQPKHRLARFLNPIVIFGAVVGMTILVTTYSLSNASIPYVSMPMVAVIGTGLGVMIGMFSEKFSPVRADEIMAGLALGLSNAQIMHEIVIPDGRPGLLNLLNRTKQKF
ncbi:MAG TPA: hypothetical protein GX739_02740 [Firmicutes bacterium]|nr:hypothetical protein [Bacillota bacterium]